MICGTVAATRIPRVPTAVLVQVLEDLALVALVLVVPVLVYLVDALLRGLPPVVLIGTVSDLVAWD